MLSRITKTLGTNAAIVGVALLVAGAGGASMALVAAPSPSPSEQRADVAKQQQADRLARAAAREAAAAATPEASAAADSRPTDTHGYCVSQVAQNAPTAHTGEGDARVTHGTLVRAAAHACGKTTDADKAARVAERTAKAAERQARKAERQAEREARTTGKPQP